MRSPGRSSVSDRSQIDRRTISGQAQAVRDRKSGKQQVTLGSAICFFQVNSNSGAGDFGAFSMRGGGAALCSPANRPRVIGVLTCANDRNLGADHPCDHQQRPHYSAEAASCRAIAGGERCARAHRCSRDAGIQSQRGSVSGPAGARALRLHRGWPLPGLRRDSPAHLYRRPPRPPGCLSLPALALDHPCGARRAFGQGPHDTARRPGIRRVQRRAHRDGRA